MLALAFALLFGGGAGEPAANAEVVFFGPDSLTVQCVEGCRDDKVYLPDRFPEQRVPAEGAAIRLRFRAAGFRSAVDEYRLQPGQNRIIVELART